MDASVLFEKTKEYLPAEKHKLLEEAYLFAEKCHLGQSRMSGEPYIEHPLNVALILANLQMDAPTIAGALLHDVVEDCGITLEEMERRFGPDVRRLVDGATKLSKIEAQLEKRDGAQVSHSDIQTESLRKMLVAMAEDIRVILIKLADRLHNMRTLKPLSVERQRRIAQETLDIYTPLAHRLGMWEIKWQLEDLSLRYLEPEKYKEISKLLTTKRGEREAYTERVVKALRQELDKAGIKAQVLGRPKHIFSIYQKIKKYAAQGKQFGQIYDLFAVRVLVDTVEECYRTLGTVHALWHPLPGQFDDYIANPKENMYQSLHTTVMALDGQPLEIQIRTQEMHEISEYGVAAHWQYKEGGSKDLKFEEKMSWLRQLIEWQKNAEGAEEFLDSVKTDIFQDQVFVYTPKGDIVELPAHSAPLDFAFKIHTALGYRCIGAKVNSKMVSLDTELQNGDTVEVVVSKTSRGPSLDWLNPDLGYVRTAHAREKVRQWFRKQEHAANVERGKELLDREAKRLNVPIDEAELAPMFHCASTDEFLASLGAGIITQHQLQAKVVPQKEEASLPMVSVPHVGDDYGDKGVNIQGVDNLLTRLAKCCNPVPGDEVAGFITRLRGITIHRKDCYNVKHAQEQERLVKVNWGTTKTDYPVRVHVEAWDRVGLLKDMTTLVSDVGVNIQDASVIEHDDRSVSIYMTLQINSVSTLTKIFSKLEAVRGVINVERVKQ
ncbi:MAG: bifunctional (p)ppGpp synthetase/guanosine-3',5'-bis(diphosphate) 3'-pyrophosphohydrolase [Dehalococcoidia bacterium]|nr:bifunctional (p)ppGpp synthetase/guanosine-3',5'-bis(diphosphate) 3'-pyrophosphohydrolase [Dehalococcoidia bacterium]